MEDHSYLDKKYFIDRYVYNCPFCNRNNVQFEIKVVFQFDWAEAKKCNVCLVACSSCGKMSMHLSYERICDHEPGGKHWFKENIDIDSKIFYSVPTSFFVMDSRIPKIIRELITESEGCLKMNYLTGASACMRKAIYELTVLEKAEGEDYEKKIKFLKGKYPGIDPAFFDILANIQGMTSNKIHEQSWDKWDSRNLKYIIETLKATLYEIYVEPRLKEERKKKIAKMIEDLTKDKKGEKLIEEYKNGEPE